MNKKIPSLVATLACLAVAPLASAAFTEDFSSLAAWNTYKSGDGALDAGIVAGSLSLATENTPTAGVTRAVRAITQTASADLNPFKSGGPASVDLVFNELSIQSAGATTSFLFGITNDSANANIYNRTNSLYFSQNGLGNASLVLRNNNTATTLWSTTTAGDLSLNYSSISISFTATTWSLSTYGQTGDSLVSTSGLLSTPTHAGWQSDLYVSLTLNQSSTTGGVSNISHTTLLLDGINVSSVPEPAAAAMLLGGAVLGLAGTARRRRVRG